jgi:all-trans-retinol dehydrogenase (NAD+)
LQEACTETARIIAESGGTAKAYRCDVTNVDAVADMAARVRREVGNVDILVNNAGVLVVKNILELTDDEIRRTINVNTVAQFWVSNRLWN